MTLKQKDILINDLIKENADVTIAEYLDILCEIEAIENSFISVVKFSEINKLNTHQ